MNQQNLEIAYQQRTLAWKGYLDALDKLPENPSLWTCEARCWLAKHCAWTGLLREFGAVQFEVFDPADGLSLYTTRYSFVAWLVALLTGLDWDKEGEGW